MFDVIIVGAGPAGVFAALELSERSDLRIGILDKGQSIEDRHCPSRDRGGKCRQCQPCAIMAGWGGAGAYSDGKLTLSPAIGGRLADILGQEKVGRLIREVDQTYVRFGASGSVYGRRTDQVEALEKRAALAGLRFISVPIRHIGTERCAEVMRAMRDELVKRDVEVKMRTPVVRVLVESGRRLTPKRLARSIVTPTLSSATPGDLNLALPYRHVVTILEMLHAMDELAPGMASRHTSLYGLEVKFYSCRLRLTPQMETEVANLFACGDGAGVTRGLVQASASGLVAARAILRRLAN